MNGKLFCGDCVVVMKTFPSESIDCIVTDPPYGYSFMGKDWDKVVPSVEVWRECLRVLKSGAFAFVMSSPRQDVLSQMIVRLGQAGFETGFTSIYWAYASGFPKAMNIGKAVDKRLGVERIEVIGERHRHVKPYNDDEGWNQNSTKGDYQFKAPASPEAKFLDGCYGGFQPKPALEVVIVCMKPLSEKTYVDQALANQKGVTWLDNTRIPFESTDDIIAKNPHTQHKEEATYEDYHKRGDDTYELPKGRFPANLLVSDDVLNDGKITTSEGGKTTRLKESKTEEWGYKEFHMQGYGDSGSFSRYFDLDKWFEKTVEKLPESVRKTFPFLICPKASKSERNRGLENLPEKEKYSDLGLKQRMENGQVTNPRTNEEATKTKNFHPTVKPLKLMSYLITLGSRPNDVVLDPFVGSGTTCLAAKILNRKWLGVDISKEYCAIASARLGGAEVVDVDGVSIPNVIIPMEKKEIIVESRESGVTCGYVGKCNYKNEDGRCSFKRPCKEKR